MQTEADREGQTNQAARDSVAGRLAVLRLAEELGNAAEACRRAGMDRTSFFSWRRRFRESGIEGLKDRSPLARHRPHAALDQIAERIERLALDHPDDGCNRLQKMLAEQDGVALSAITIQNILNKRGLGKQHHRLLILEERFLANPAALTPSQLHFVKRLNPCLGDCDLTEKAPGELLCAFTMPIGPTKTIGRLYLHGVVDAGSLYAFALLSDSRDPTVSIALLHGRVLPFFARLGVKVSRIATAHDAHFCDLFGLFSHTYQVYLACRGLKSRQDSHHGFGSGFADRFVGSIRKELLRSPQFRNAQQDGISLNTTLHCWLADHNHRRVSDGFPVYGRTPAAVIEGHGHSAARLSSAASGETRLPEVFLREARLALELVDLDQRIVQSMRETTAVITSRRHSRWQVPPSLNISACFRVLFERQLDELNELRALRAEEAVVFNEKSVAPGRRPSPRSDVWCD